MRGMEAIAKGEFRDRFQRMGANELLALAQGYDTLALPAQAALRAEFEMRGMRPPLLVEPGAAEQLEWVTLRSFRDLSEAIVARSMLESAGISVNLRDENLVRLDWQVSNFIGGIRLQVEARDRETAVALLQQPTPEEFLLEDGAEFVQPHCPVCGSVEITFEGPSRRTALLSLYVFSVPFPTGAPSWHCETCDSRWVEED